MSDDDVCLSVAYIGPKSRTERPRKTKIGTEVAHVTRDSDTTFKVKGQLVAGGGILWRPCAQLIIIIIIHSWLGIGSVKNCWFVGGDISTAVLHVLGPIVTTSITLSSNKIQNEDIVVPANPGPPEKWPFKQRESLWNQLTRVVLQNGC